MRRDVSAVVFVVEPLRRMSSVANRVHRLSFVGNRTPETASFARGLVTIDDESGQWDVITDVLGSKQINHIKQLSMVL